MLQIIPIGFREACAFVQLHHRHHRPPQGHKFSIGLSNGERIVGVAMVGRPVARRLDNGFRLEVTRLCTDGTRNACSKLYGASWRIAREMGYRELVTYILDTETGTSLKAAGWLCLGRAGGISWDVPSRPREDHSPRQLKIKYARKEVDNLSGEDRTVTNPEI